MPNRAVYSLYRGASQKMKSNPARKRTLCRPMGSIGVNQNETHADRKRPSAMAIDQEFSSRAMDGSLFMAIFLEFARQLLEGRRRQVLVVHHAGIDRLAADANEL